MAAPLDAPRSVEPGPNNAEIDSPAMDAMFRALIATTQDAVIAIDRQARITLFNDAAERMFELSRDEVLGQKVNMLMPERYGLEHDEYISRYEMTRHPVAIGRIRTVTGRRSDGEEFPMELSVTEIDLGGQVRYAALIRDISEKVRLQQQLVRRERMVAIGTAASRFAHEIGNPLNGMSVNAQLVRRWLRRSDIPTDDRIIGRLDSLLEDIDRLTELLGEFRTLSRKERFVFHPTDIRQLIHEVFDAELDVWKTLGITAVRDVGDDLPHIPVDSMKIYRVLLNLCKNAAEAMPQGGTLRACAQRTERGVAIEIIDTGHGIPDDLDIFEPFATSKPMGTGLGLAIVRQIVEAHRGLIEVDSSPQGTTFRIELPG